MRLRPKTILVILICLFTTTTLMFHWELSASQFKESSQQNSLGGNSSNWVQSTAKNTTAVLHTASIQSLEKEDYINSSLTKETTGISNEGSSKLNPTKDTGISWAFINETTKPSNTGTFQSIIKDTYVYSAFIDETAQKIRLVVLSGKHHQPKIICHYCHDELTCHCPSQSAEYYTHNENHGALFGGFMVSCQLPSCFTSRYFISLSVDDETKQLRVPLVSMSLVHDKHDEYAICTPPLRGQGREFLYQIAEFIELSLIIGFNHVTFYDYQIDNTVKKLLLYYQQKGVVSIKTWNLPGHMSKDDQLWYHGQVLAIQDCLFRGRATSKFIAFNDIDEFFVPLKRGRTIPSLLRKIHTSKHSGHCFDSVIFGLNTSFPNAWKSGLRTVLLERRTRQIVEPRTKCIVDPRRVFEMGIHHVSKLTDEQFKVDKVHQSQGLLFHYRKCSKDLSIGNMCNDLVTDITMQRFTRTLEENVDRVVRLVAP